MSKVTQNYVDVIFILNLGQMDRAGQRRLGPKQLDDMFTALGEASQKLKPPSAWQPLYSVPWAGWGGGSGRRGCRAGGRQPQKYIHLALNLSPLTGVPKLFRTRAAADSAPFPLPCIHPALNKCPLSGWELGSSPTGCLRGAPWTSQLSAPCISGCFLTSCPASLAAPGTTTGSGI